MDIKNNGTENQIIDSKPVENIETPVNPTNIQENKQDNSSVIEKLQKELQELKELIKNNKIQTPQPVEQKTVVDDDFEIKMAAYEKKKFDASLTAEDKAKLSKIPNSNNLSIEQMQYFLNLEKQTSTVPTKNFPQISGGASNTVEPISQDDYVKNYKEWEKSQKKGGKK